MIVQATADGVRMRPAADHMRGALADEFDIIDIAAAAIAVFLLALRWFDRAEGNFAEVI